METIHTTPTNNKQICNFIRGLNGCTITKYRSIAIASEVNVETYTDTPNENGTK
jgi:hypothetical protein